MRVHKESQGITVNAISGTHIVFLGMNIKASFLKGFRGFAIHRSDLVENESYWLRGLKCFESTSPMLVRAKHLPRSGIRSRASSGQITVQNPDTNIDTELCACMVIRQILKKEERLRY